MNQRILLGGDEILVETKGWEELTWERMTGKKKKKIIPGKYVN